MSCIAKFNAVRNKQQERAPPRLCSNCFLWFQSKEQGTRVKDRTKNGTLFPFSCGQNRKSRSLVFLCSQTKRKRLLRRRSTTSCHWSAVSLVKQVQTDLFVHATAPFTWYSISWRCLWALFSLCILHLPTNLHPFIFLLKLVKQVPGYVGIGAHGCEMQIYQLLWHYCM